MIHRAMYAAAVTATVGILVSACGRTDPNDRPTYGESGLPKNCRAVIAANINGWQQKQFTADEALRSIDRNCGLFGTSWGQ